MSTTTLPSNETTLLTAANKPPGRICLVAGTLYVQDNKSGAVTRLKKYAKGDYFDRKGVPGRSSFAVMRELIHRTENPDATGPAPVPTPMHVRSKYFNSYRKTCHRGIKRPTTVKA